jgi:biotin transport system substrate-specific component
MMVNAKLDLQKAFLLDLAYYPGDIIKNLLAVSIALALHKAFPDLLVRRPGVRSHGTDRGKGQAETAQAGK